MRLRRWDASILTGEEQAKLVHSSLASGDNEALCLLLPLLDQFRRVRLARHYRALYGRSVQKLSRSLEETLAGDFLEICQCIVIEPNMLFVKEIHSFLQDFPVAREELLVAMLCERSKEELLHIEDTYKKKYSKSLVDDMDEHLEPEAAKWMKFLITWKESDSCCNLIQASNDTQRLLSLGMGVYYGDEGPVIGSLLNARCSSHMRNVFKELRRLGKPPLSMIEVPIPPSLRKRIANIIQAIETPEMFNARVLLSSRRGPGTFWKNVLLVKLSRSKEFYKKVELAFGDLQSTGIREEVSRDTGGSSALLLRKLLKF